MTQSIWGKYNKGLQNPEIADTFFKAVDKKDTFEASNAADAGGERLQVDYALCDVKSEDRLIISRRPLVPPTKEQFERDLAVLRELEPLRDKPLSSLTRGDMPSADEEEFEALTRVSWFLSDEIVAPYNTKDYAPTNDMVGGKAPTKTQSTGPEILMGDTAFTGRGAATYVHKDDPMLQWMKVLKFCLRTSVPKKRGKASGLEHGDFAYAGYPYLIGLYGEALRRAGMISFTQKWIWRALRPEGHGISQVFQEGSPMHPSFPAMHGFAAFVLCGVTLKIFDEFHVLPNGRTLGEECWLMAMNIAHWRSWAGVHYPSDNVASIDQAFWLADRIVEEIYRL